MLRGCGCLVVVGIPKNSMSYSANPNESWTVDQAFELHPPPRIQFSNLIVPLK